jgi:hypothetical protein
MLNDRLIRKISVRFEDAKAVMMLRDPVARLWSQWRMHLEFIDASEQEFVDYAAFKVYARRVRVRERSYPTAIARRWSRHFGDRFRVFFLDDVVARPDETRREILAFLGGDPNVPPVLGADFNRKARTKAPQRTKEIQTLMRKLFEKERRACAETFGGPAQSWPHAPY